MADNNLIEFKSNTTPPVINAGDNPLEPSQSHIDGSILILSEKVVRHSTIEAALTRWREHYHQLELQTVATNTVIIELTKLLAPVPEQVPVNPVPEVKQ